MENPKQHKRKLSIDLKTIQISNLIESKYLFFSQKTFMEIQDGVK
jgi:hypothetical protein